MEINKKSDVVCEGFLNKRSYTKLYSKAESIVRLTDI